ncbi:dimethylsulfonioproprionate lyase family protein [Pseudooceanicola endophyticus]|nr:dimethylsulfonioproprionate lyase family protein [Pseudooceanicola endophyticus]
MQGARPAQAHGPIAARTAPVVDRYLAPALARAGGTAAVAPLIEAIGTLVPQLCWRPRADGPNASEGFSAAHANAMIAGPGGLQDRQDIWIGLSLLAPETRYPDHAHSPEETYLTLSPGEFRVGSVDWFTPGIGGSFYVPPAETHAMKSGDTPLLALWALRA